MNKTIQKLADQCRTEYHNGYGGFVEQFDEEKFAELLIRKCIDLAVKEEERYDSLSSVHAAYCSMSMSNFQEVLKKHFGVEE